MNIIEHNINPYSPIANEPRSWPNKLIASIQNSIQKNLLKLAVFFLARPLPVVVQSLENRVTIYSRNTVLFNEELLSVILDFSTPSDVHSMTQVCHEIYAIPSRKNMLRNAFTNACLEISFLPKDWSNFGIIRPFSSSIPEEIRAVLNSNCPFNPGKIIAQTHILLFMPDLVNGQPLTLHSFRVLMEHPTNGLPSRFRDIWDQIIQDHGDTPLGRSGYVLITKDVIPDSRDQTYANQKALIRQHGGVAYEPPSFLEMVILLAAVHNKKGVRLYGNNPSTYTSCQERFKVWQLAVGGFAPADLSIDIFPFVSKYLGVAARRKL